MRKWIKRLALGLVILISLLSIVWVAVLMTGKKRLDEELAYWRDRGVEVEIHAGADINTSETGDPRILRVIELYADVPESTLDLINSSDEADPDALGDAVRSCDEVLVLIHKIAAAEQAIWKEDVLTSPDRLDDLVVRLTYPRSIARLLDAEALVRARTGDLDGACESIAAGLSIGRQVGEHHATIAVLVQAAIDEQMIDRLESIYSHGGLPTQQVIDAISQIDMPAKFLPTLQWEGVHMTRVGTGHALSPWSLHDTAYSLEQYRRMTESIETYGVPLRELEFWGDHPWWAMKYTLIEPGLHSLTKGLIHLQARIEMAKTAVRLRKYKMEHGAYPQWLDELKGLPADPYSGKAFEYQSQNDGFMLISYMRGGGKRMEWRWEE